MKPIQIAMVGTNGHQITGLLRGVRSARLVGLAEFEPARLAQAEKDFPDVLEGAPRFGSLEELLRKTDCELVSLCSTRRDQQANQILACLAAGRQVLAEKPLCTALDDLPRIRAAAKKADRKVWAMLTMVTEPIFQEFAKLVRSGRLGEVGHVFAQKSYKFGGFRPQDRGVDGGIIQAAIHAVSFVRWTTGLEFAELSAVDSAVGNDKPGNLQVEMALTARLNNGALCQIVSNYLNPANAPWWGNDQLRIHGTRGMVETVDGLTQASFYLESGIRHEEVKSDHPSYLPALLEEVATGKPWGLSMEDSFRCTQIALEAQASAGAGGVLRTIRF